MKTLRLTTEQLIQIVLSGVGAVCGEQRCQYLSGPITGGERYIRYLAALRPDGSSEHRNVQLTDAVLVPNIQDLINEGNRQRHSGRKTIEPGTFEARITGWGQEEYYALWDQVIESYCDRVVFLPGWEYSLGCVREYLSAKALDKPTWSLSGTELTKIDARNFIRAAIKRIEEASKIDGCDLDGLIEFKKRLQDQANLVSLL